MVETRNGIRGKVCSTCRKWKPLDDFPTDPTHQPSQGGRHCRCKECHKNAASKHRAVARRIKNALAAIAVFATLSAPAKSKLAQTRPQGAPS
jgi:hypothetical protein